MTARFSNSEKQSPATFTHGRRSDKDIIVIEVGTRAQVQVKSMKNTTQRLVDMDHKKKKGCSSSQGLSHKVQLFSAWRYGHKDTSMLLEVVPQQGWQHSAG